VDNNGCDWKILTENDKKVSLNRAETTQRLVKSIEKLKKGH
jgi:hypothetical protein